MFDRIGRCRVPNPPNYAAAVREKTLTVVRIALALPFPVLLILWLMEVI